MYKREVYLDYAASTPLSQESRDAILYTMDYLYGNPAAIHLFGRKSNVAIEQARRTIADLLHCGTHNLVFASGATEIINLSIPNICQTYKPKAIVTSELEHAAMRKTIENVSHSLSIPVIYIRHDERGAINLSDLDTQLQRHPSSLLCLMHANNEIGNLLPLVEVGTICKKYATLFFCDMVQSIGKYDLSLSGLPIDFAVASAHKFYGPKAVGLFYFTRKIPPFFYGGAQERTMRAGTENIYGICGMEKALQTSLHRLREMQTQVLSIKSYCVKRLVDTFDSISFIGDCKDGGLYNLLNFYFSDTNMETLRMRLDMAGIAVSSASACSSGTEEQSHVVAALNLQTKSLRVSFGIQTTSQDIDYLIETLTEILKNNP